MQKRVIALLTALLILISGCYIKTAPSATTAAEPPVSTTNAKVTVHFLDVGQGDSTFIELPDGETMLIDAGVAGAGPDICEYIKSLGYMDITYLVATHPHADHIGGMDEVFAELMIHTVYAPRKSTNTKTFERFLEAVADSGLKITEARAGITILDKDGVSVEILSPQSGEEYDDLNDWSAVLLLTVGSQKVLFTGDAGYAVVSKCAQDIDLLKVAHHGSRTGLNQALLDALSPEYAVISCETGNSYGHPHSEVIELLRDVPLYRTDTQGTVRAQISDGGIVFDTPPTDNRENGENK